jgi:hypothetical protein
MSNNMHHATCVWGWHRDLAIEWACRRREGKRGMGGYRERGGELRRKEKKRGETGREIEEEGSKKMRLCKQETSHFANECMRTVPGMCPQGSGLGYWLIAIAMRRAADGRLDQQEAYREHRCVRACGRRVIRDEGVV